MEELTVDQIEGWKRHIDAMSHLGMASLWRYAAPGHPVFRRDSPLYDYFKARFTSLGGFTPSISKAIDR